MTARLTIEVSYESPVSRRYIETQLAIAADHLASNGLLSGDEAEVSDWKATVDIVHVGQTDLENPE